MAINFPSTPSTGQTYAYSGHTYSYDGEKWTEVSGLGPGVKTQVFTASGTYTPTSGMRYCKVTVTACGGGGGGSDTDGTGAGIGAGGGAGGTAIKTYTAAELGATAAIVIGTAGAAGSTAGGNGGTGGNSTFTPTGGGSTLTGNGGVGGGGSGTQATDALAIAGGAGGTATNGDINLAGGNGTNGLCGPADGISNPPIAIAGAGGASFWGGGGNGRSIVLSGTAAGFDGVVYGSGGGGSVSVDNATGSIGGAGAAGVVYIEEFVGADYSSAAYIDPLTELAAATIDGSADYLLIYDGSAALNKKVLVDNIGETGFWTPVVAFGGASTGVTYAIQNATYTKVGNRCDISGQVSLTSNGTSVGALTVTGLPFTHSNASGIDTAMACFEDNMTGVSGGIMMIVGQNSAYIDVRQSITGNSSTVTDTGTTDTLNLRFGGSYQTA